MASDDKPQILIVEDDLDLSEMLNAYFRVQNYDVLTASWGEDALRISREETVDLVVLDIRLPDIDGYEVCRQLRAQHRTQDIPIIFLTEKRDRVDKLHGLELGVVDYITKPFDLQEIRLRVRNALNRVKRQPLMNPVTELPEGTLMDERLETLIFGEDENWALLVLSIPNLTEFRERYGFMVADDVLRTIAIMLKNALREHGNEADYVGHLSPEEFVIQTTKDKVTTIHDRIMARIRQSREYFYPVKDRALAREELEKNPLRMSSGKIERTEGKYATLDELKKALTEATVPEI
ncbi:MAG: response regulator [Burkholderiales bacterium]|nr:response regulator [Anaerolineae bacterium]